MAADRRSPYHFDATCQVGANDLIAGPGESNEEGHVNFVTDSPPGTTGYVYSCNFTHGTWFDELQPAMREMLRELDKPGLASVAVHRVKIP